MNYILFDDYSRHNLLPFTFTRPVCEIRIGILTIREKWERYLNTKISHQTEHYLSTKYPKIEAQDNIYINGKVCPNADIVALITKLENNKAIKSGNDLVAYRTDSAHPIHPEILLKEASEISKSYISVKEPWDIFTKNGDAIKEDYKLIADGRASRILSSTNIVIGDVKSIFIEEGAVVEASILNTKSGPIYIGADAEIMEGSVVRGPFALCEHSALKLATKVYGPTTIGPHSKVGGEINNSVIFG